MSEIKCAECEVPLTNINSSKPIEEDWEDYYCVNCYKPIECKRCGKTLYPPGIHTCTPKEIYERD